MIAVDVHKIPRWILDLLYVPKDIPENAEAWISLKRFPESGWALLAVLALVAGVAFIGSIYRRELTLSTRRKIVYATIRSCVLIAIAMALFLPVLEVSVERTDEAKTLVLIDDSLSFGIIDRYASDPQTKKTIADALKVAPSEVASLTRAQIAERLLARSDLLNELQKSNLVQGFVFSSRLEMVSHASRSPAGTDDTKTATPAPDDELTNDDPHGGNGDDEPERQRRPAILPPSISPQGTVTDLGLVRKAVEEQGNAPIAAVVLFTDGKTTAGEDPTSLGAFLKEREIPMYVVGVGDPTPTKNIRVMAMFAPERVFLDDPAVVDVRLDHRGFEGETVTVELTRADVVIGDGEATPEEVMKTVNVTFGASAETTARFEVSMDRLGRQRLAARVAPRDDETFDTDNDRVTIVEVVDQPTKVLLVAGLPSNEFRMLRNFLRRDSRVHVAAWLMSADPNAPQEGNTVLEKLPATPKEVFEYDVILLLDPNPQGFPPSFVKTLENFVSQHRGGLGFVAGERYTGTLFSKSEMAPILEILAVEPDMGRIDAEVGREPFHTREWALVATREALSHAATRLTSRPETNREHWAELPGIFWSLPVERPKPGATVLLEHPNPRFAINNARRPLVAHQFYGGGRSMFVGFDETWRWRALAEDIYDKFWMQTIRSLTEGRLLGDRRQLVVTDRDSYALGGEPIRVSALVQDQEYRPVTDPSKDVEIMTPSGPHRLTLERDAGQAGWYRGHYVPDDVGTFRIHLPGSSGSEKIVRVEVPDVEYQDPRLDHATLEELARSTRGEVIRIDEVVDLPKKIPPDPRRRIVADEPKPLWDNSLTLGFVVMLLTLEWILRKWSRLP